MWGVAKAGVDHTCGAGARPVPEQRMPKVSHVNKLLQPREQVLKLPCRQVARQRCAMWHQPAKYTNKCPAVVDQFLSSIQKESLTWSQYSMSCLHFLTFLPHFMVLIPGSLRAMQIMAPPMSSQTAKWALFKWSRFFHKPVIPCNVYLPATDERILAFHCSVY